MGGLKTMLVAIFASTFNMLMAFDFWDITDAQEDAITLWVNTALIPMLIMVTRFATKARMGLGIGELQEAAGIIEDDGK